MKWNKSTRFGLYAAMEMARAGKELVQLSTIAERYGISAHHLSKVMQQLVRAGLARAVRGVGGGYALTRPAKAVTLLDIVEVFEGPTDLEQCLLRGGDEEACGDSGRCRLKRVFDEIEEQAYFTLKSTRLSTLVEDPTTTT